MKSPGLIWRLFLKNSAQLRPQICYLSTNLQICYSWTKIHYFLGPQILYFWTRNNLSFPGPSLDTSRYGYVHYWHVIIYHNVWKDFISTWQRTFSSSDITSKRQFTCFPSQLTWCVRLPSIHLDFHERKKARSRREPASYSTKLIFYICRWLRTQKTTSFCKKYPPVYFARNTKHAMRSWSQWLTQAREKEELVAKKKEELDVEQLRVVWQSIRGAGFQSLHDYLHTLFNTRDPILSAQVSRMLSYHGSELLDSIHACHPDMAVDWALSTSATCIEAEWKVLVRDRYWLAMNIDR